MKTPTLELFKIFKKQPATKPATDHHAKITAPTQSLIKTMPSWWMVLFAYILAMVFCYSNHKFFLWIPPYLQEILKNLKGLPQSWGDLGLYWGERGLKTIAIAAAVYHNLWQISTRYKLTSHDIYIESWFPIRKVTAVPYGSVRKVGFQQSPLGLIFNYGHIEIDTGSSTGPLILFNCPKPKKFQQTLQSKVESVLQPNLTALK